MSRNTQLRSIWVEFNERFRVMDRRLQALRKKGVIAWKRKGSSVVWILTEPLTTDLSR